VSRIETHPPEPWWREWPLALAVVTLTLALLGKSWIATALDRPVMLIALLAILCSVILAQRSPSCGTRRCSRIGSANPWARSC